MYIYMAIPNKSPLKILEKIERGHIQGLSKFFGYPLLSHYLIVDYMYIKCSCSHVKAISFIVVCHVSAH